MAGDWIKMRSNLRRHPKVVRLASALNADRLRVVGGLHAVWCLFDEHSEDGCLCGYTPAAIDDEIGWAGFCAQLIAIGWVDSDGNDGLSLPEFDTHNGASAKRRAMEADRKRAERAAASEHPQSVGSSSALHADTKRTREEKRRGEKKEEGKPRVARPTLDGVSPELLADYLKVRTAKRAGPLTETAVAGLEREASKAGITLEQAVTACVEFGWQGFNAGWYAERQGSQRGAVQHTPAADPDSRAAIEAEGIAKGFGPWDQLEQFGIYKTRVRGARQVPALDLNALGAMAARRQGAH